MPEPPKIDYSELENKIDYSELEGAPEKGLMQRFDEWWPNQPLTTIGSRTAKAITDPMRGFGFGNQMITAPIKIAGSLADSLTSPLSLATMGMGTVEQLAAKYGLPVALKLASLGTRALSAPFAAEGIAKTGQGAYNLDPAEFGAGVLETLGGGLGMFHSTPKIQPQILPPETTVDPNRMLRGQRIHNAPPDIDVPPGRYVAGPSENPMGVASPAVEDIVPQYGDALRPTAPFNATERFTPDVPPEARAEVAAEIAGQAQSGRIAALYREHGAGGVTSEMLEPPVTPHTVDVPQLVPGEEGYRVRQLPENAQSIAELEAEQAARDPRVLEANRVQQGTDAFQEFIRRATEANESQTRNDQLARYLERVRSAGSAEPVTMPARPAAPIPSPVEQAPIQAPIPEQIPQSQAAPAQPISDSIIPPPNPEDLTIVLRKLRETQAPESIQAPTQAPTPNVEAPIGPVQPPFNLSPPVNILGKSVYAIDFSGRTPALVFGPGPRDRMMVPWELLDTLRSTGRSDIPQRPLTGPVKPLAKPARVPYVPPENAGGRLVKPPVPQAEPIPNLQPNRVAELSAPANEVVPPSIQAPVEAPPTIVPSEPPKPSLASKILKPGVKRFEPIAPDISGSETGISQDVYDNLPESWRKLNPVTSPTESAPIPEASTPAPESNLASELGGKTLRKGVTRFEPTPTPEAPVPASTVEPKLVTKIGDGIYKSTDSEHIIRGVFKKGEKPQWMLEDPDGSQSIFKTMADAKDKLKELLGRLGREEEGSVDFSKFRPQPKPKPKVEPTATVAAPTGDKESALQEFIAALTSHAQNSTLPKIKIHRANVEILGKTILDSPTLSPSQKPEALLGFMKVLRGEVPERHQLDYLSGILGEDTTRIIKAKIPSIPLKTQIWQEGGNLSKALQASCDLSFPLRQGAGAVTYKAWWQAWDDMFKAVGSDKAFREVMDSIYTHPDFQTGISGARITKSFADRAGLSMSGLNELGKREEMIMSNLAERIPYMGRIVRASNRAYTGFANKLRADMFNDLIKKQEMVADAAKTLAKNPAELAEAQKLSPHYNLEYAKKIADYVNNSTGRGSLMGLEKHTASLNSVFFSPRFQLSRINMIGQALNPRTYISKPRVIRMAYLRSLMGVAGMWGTAVSLAKIGGADVSTDPTSSDFGKIKVGNARFDFGAGFQQPIVLTARMITGRYTSSTSNKVQEYGKGYGAKTRWDAQEDYLLNKTNPIVALYHGIMNASDYQPIGLGDRAISMATPMFVQDMVDLWNEDPSLIPWAVLPALTGAGSQVYGSKPEPTFISNENDFVLGGKQTAQ